MKKGPLQITGNVFDLSTIMLYSGLIFQQLCSICLFVTSFIFLLWKRVTPYYLAIVILLTAVFGFMLWFFVVLSSDERNLKALSTPLRTGLIILVFSSALAPVLHSLLDTVSTDTIYAMTSIFLFLNFASLPYANGMRSSRVDGTTDSNIVSVATGFLASLCMASRLPGPKETLLLIISATLVFATWPTIRHRIQVCKGKKTRFGFTIGMGAAAALSLLPFFFDDEIESVYKGLIATATLLSTFLINFSIPFIFYKMQSIKSNINGPWDEAVIEH
ncbi:phosphatidylinositol [Echinococcus multilocularis]|uniref:Phosphatidylinositol n=1 Tax=Echinococcus multilocularis TaxID=6211 RepID=A0A068YGY4_ECHMU|nr:phosphatidylinositol [Echinococcus multilocularis]